MRLVILLAPLLLAPTALGQVNSGALFGLWSKIKKPLAGDSDPIGTYTAGCLVGARALPLDGIGYSVMRPSRLRYYGHNQLLDFIESLGKKMKERGLPRLLVGDMGRPRGGPMLGGHASHQNGLDVDLWYEMSIKKPSKREREEWGADSFANRAKNELSPAWGNAQRKLVSLAASAELVDRIFVHPAIKRDLCAAFSGADWLYKIRPWWNHHDHLHARLRCPHSSGQCAPQEPLDPKNAGCGDELSWWFSEEAKEEGRKKAATFAEREFPDLPPACGQMLKGVR